MLATHTDVVGSLLRPSELLRAQERLAAGLINRVQFEQIEDHAVDDAVALQESVGLEIVTDGEMRRQSFQSQMTAAVSGFGEHNLEAFLWGDWYDDTGMKKTRRPRRLGVVGQAEAASLSLSGRVCLPQRQNESHSQSDTSKPQPMGEFLVTEIFKGRLSNA